MVFPFANAEILIPAKTRIYFEENGNPYNEKISFTLKGYGYDYLPGSPVEKEKGNYTPEEVFYFSGIYEEYGEMINEDYLRDSFKIDYYELEGKTSEGKIFLIRGIHDVPTSCKWTDKLSKSENNEEEYLIIKTCELRFNLDDADWNAYGKSPEIFTKIRCFFKKLFLGVC